MTFPSLYKTSGQYHQQLGVPPSMLPTPNNQNIFSGPASIISPSEVLKTEQNILSKCTSLFYHLLIFFLLLCLKQGLTVWPRLVCSSFFKNRTFVLFFEKSMHTYLPPTPSPNSFQTYLSPSPLPNFMFSPSLSLLSNSWSPLWAAQTLVGVGPSSGA